jgi:hypothetical protein
MTGETATAVVEVERVPELRQFLGHRAEDDLKI